MIDREIYVLMNIFTLTLKKLVGNYSFSRLSNLMSFQQRTLSMKLFVEAQFGYCLLVWMFHDRELN